MTRVGVLGAGAWGTALSDLLARNGHDVRLWAYEPEVVASINAQHVNTLYFPDAALDHRLIASHSIPEVLDGAQMICSVVPSHVTRGVFELAAPFITPGTRLVCATKGIETETLDLMSDIAAEVLPHAPFVALSGPSFAHEVHEGQPTAVVAASGDPAACMEVQACFSNSYFRVYSGTDVTGVELAGSLKNTIAIAAGVLEGLGMGNNPRAALLTRGLAEIARLGQALGAEAKTFSGLAGMGDLILTCTGALSRNRQLGTFLAQGMTLDEYRATHRNVAEGVNTALGASRLAQRHGVAMPITEQVAAILFDGASPREAIRQLMERELKAEE